MTTQKADKPRVSACTLCNKPGGTLIGTNPHYRVVFAGEPLYPCFVRVVWNDHAKEMSELSPVHQTMLMRAVFVIEAQMRRVLSPDKINLASFGNVVPHLHWHVIARWTDDTHWPQPTWGTRQRDGAVHGADKMQALAGAICAALELDADPVQTA